MVKQPLFSTIVDHHKPHSVLPCITNPKKHTHFLSRNVPMLFYDIKRFFKFNSSFLKNNESVLWYILLVFFNLPTLQFIRNILVGSFLERAIFLILCLIHALVYLSSLLYISRAIYPSFYVCVSLFWEYDVNNIYSERCNWTLYIV